MAGEAELFGEITPTHLFGHNSNGEFGKIKVLDLKRSLNLSPSICPIPSDLNWLMDKYPIEVGYNELNGVRKASPTGWTPWGTGNSDPYSQCLNGNKYYVDVVSGNDSTGTGSLANPYKTVPTAQAAANAAGQPCSILVNASGKIGRTSGSLWGGAFQAPTVPTAYLARNGTIVIGSFDNYAYVADATNNWTFRVNSGRAGVTAVYDMTRFDRFGHFTPLLKVSSVAACARIPGSWFMDTASSPASPVIHPFDETIPTNATHMLLIDPNGGDGMDKTMGNNPQHIFFDGETANDSWEVRGQRLKTFAANYGSSDKIAAFRRVSVKYVDQVNADNRNAFSLDNWRGIGWYEDCYAGKIAYDSFNGHNSNNGANSLMVTVNCKADDCGIVGLTNLGSQNHLTQHEDMVSIDIAGDYNFARGANIALVGTSRTLIHGTRVRNDRGDIEIAGGTNFPTEVRTRDTARAWLSEMIIEPIGGGLAINSSSSNPVLIRNMVVRGRTAGAINSW